MRTIAIPIHDFEIIEHELAAFSPALAEKPMIVVATKLDATTDRTHLDELREVCGATRAGVSLHFFRDGGGHCRTGARYGQCAGPDSEADSGDGYGAFGEAGDDHPQSEDRHSNAEEYLDEENEGNMEEDHPATPHGEER